MNASLGWRVLGGVSAILAGIAARKLLVTSLAPDHRRQPARQPGRPRARTGARRSSTPWSAGPRWAWPGCWRPARPRLLREVHRTPAARDGRGHLAPRSGRLVVRSAGAPALRDHRGKPAAPAAAARGAGRARDAAAGGPGAGARRALGHRPALSGAAGRRTALSYRWVAWLTPTLTRHPSTGGSVRLVIGLAVTVAAFASPAAASGGCTG